MKKRSATIGLLLAAALLTGCEKMPEPENTAPTQPGQDQTLVVGATNFDGNFSPFFDTNTSENDVLRLVHTPLLGTDREGAVVLQGIAGETRPYNNTDYTYTGIADCVVTENPDGTAFYDFTLREGVRFSDGTIMDIDDVIFSLYVPLDPTYDGSMTLSSLPIQGLDAYRSGVQTRTELILEAGPEGYSENDYFTREQYESFWPAFWAAGETFAQQIVDYCVSLGYGADSADVVTAATACGYQLKENATLADFFKAMVDKYGYDISDQGINYEAVADDFQDLLMAQLGDGASQYAAGIQTGHSAPNISGIQKTGENTLRVVLTEVSATAIYQFSTAIVPMHYYGQESLYDYENNQFGFPKGDLSHVRSVTTQPVGAGPYRFVSYKNGMVTLEANDSYWKGKPLTRYIQFKEVQDVNKVPGVASGIIDTASPAYSTETAKAIVRYNGGALSGGVIETKMVANLGYGYVGFNAKNVCVGGDPGSKASRNLRKAIATVIAVYRDVAVDSYYGEFANVINYPISDTSWAAPRVTDEGYRVAFSVDVDGQPIYREGQTAEEKYEAAVEAALEYFQAAGYAVENGKVVAAPTGAQMHYEVLVGGGGRGDHPAFMALTQASAVLGEIGFQLIVTDISNFSELTNAVNAGTAELFSMAWDATADPDMYQIYHSQGGSNEKAYYIKDEILDELILMARQTTDQMYRKTLYKECLEIVADWAVEIPMYQRQNVIIFSPRRVDMTTVTPDITTFWGWANDIEKLQMQE